jgi:hypothetical protein
MQEDRNRHDELFPLFLFSLFILHPSAFILPKDGVCGVAGWHATL